MTVMPAEVAQPQHPSEQQAIRSKCFHPTGTFVEFKLKDVEQSIPERFETIAAKYPERIGIQTKREKFTYKDLNDAANNLACRIMAEHGDHPEPVGLICDNDAWLIVAIIGVLKAGKFVTLLDPSAPKARLEHLLEDSQAQLLITETSNATVAGALAGHSRCLIRVDSVHQTATTSENRPALTPDALAFIF
jgi:non-ribosomal peptide synthetase component F